MPSLIAHESLLPNRLLAQLSTDARERLLPLLTLVAVHVGQNVYLAGSSMSAVYFPLSAVFSHIKDDEDRGKVEIATVGNEGFIGLPVLLEDQHMPMESFAQIGG